MINNLTPVSSLDLTSLDVVAQAIRDRKQVQDAWNNPPLPSRKSYKENRAEYIRVITEHIARLRERGFDLVDDSQLQRDWPTKAMHTIPCQDVSLLDLQTNILEITRQYRGTTMLDIKVSTSYQSVTISIPTIVTLDDEEWSKRLGDYLVNYGQTLQGRLTSDIKTLVKARIALGGNEALPHSLFGHRMFVVHEPNKATQLLDSNQLQSYMAMHMCETDLTIQAFNGKVHGTTYKFDSATGCWDVFNPNTSVKES